jgi:hypothetical protein
LVASTVNKYGALIAHAVAIVDNQPERNWNILAAEGPDLLLNSVFKHGECFARKVRYETPMLIHDCRMEDYKSRVRVEHSTLFILAIGCRRPRLRASGERRGGTHNCNGANKSSHLAISHCSPTRQGRWSYRPDATSESYDMPSSGIRPVKPS